MFAIMFIGIRWLEAAGRECLEPAVAAPAVAVAAGFVLLIGSAVDALRV